MKLVPVNSRFRHESEFAVGEPLPLHHSLVRALLGIPGGTAQHNPVAGPLCGCAGCGQEREIVGAALRAAMDWSAVSRRENGQALRAYLNFIPDTPAEREYAGFLQENRGRRESVVLLNLCLRDELKARRIA